MKVIELALEPIIENLISIDRNPQKGWYELKIGMPKNWVYDSNSEILCEVVEELAGGKVIKISPKNDNNNLVVDDLVAFVSVIIETNNRISNKEKEFTDKMEEMKVLLENEAKKFYQELDELKENSFKNLNDKFVEEINGDNSTKEKKIKKNIEKKSTISDDNSVNQN